MGIIEELKGKLKYDKGYYFQDDSDYLKKYDERIKIMSDEDKKKYEYHLNVLPHPFFGDIEKADVLILAKNPSYDLGDEFETWFYEKEKASSNGKIDLNDYINELKNVDFFKDWNDETTSNKFFFDSWKWWHDIFEGLELKEGKKVGIINLTPYRSKSYFSIDNVESNWQKIIKKYVNNNLKLFFEIEKNKLLITVWGENDWGISNDFTEPKKYLLLNLNSKGDSMGVSKRNIIFFMEQRNREEFKNIYDDVVFKKLDELFEVKEKTMNKKDFDIELKKLVIGNYADIGFNDVRYEKEELFDKWTANMNKSDKDRYCKELIKDGGKKPKMASYGSSSRFVYKTFKGRKNLDKVVPQYINNGNFEFEKIMKGHVRANFDMFYGVEKNNYYFEAKCHEIFDNHSPIFAKSYSQYFGKIKHKDYNGKQIIITDPIFSNDTKIVFDIKQFICHVLAITNNKKENVTDHLIYLLYAPKELKNKLSDVYNLFIEQYKEAIKYVKEKFEINIVFKLYFKTSIEDKEEVVFIEKKLEDN